MTTKRPSCSQCLRPLTECYCHAITVLHSDVRIIILQHHSEVAHPFNTARMAELALHDCHIVVGESFSLSQPEISTLCNADFSPMLLFPVMHPISMAEQRLRVKEQGKAPLLFIPDGTWKKAKKILHCSPDIAALPSIKLDAMDKSIYGVRKSTQEGGVSTVEACFHFLSQWSGSPEHYAPLLHPLQWLAERQRTFKP